MMRIIYGPGMYGAACPNGESGGNPNAVSPDGQNNGGLQINDVHIPKVMATYGVTDWWEAKRMLLIPEVNVEIAHQVWLSSGYGAWSCY